MNDLIVVEKIAEWQRLKALVLDLAFLQHACHFVRLLQNLAHHRRNALHLAGGPRNTGTARKACAPDVA
jgi:hypothetical protein